MIIVRLVLLIAALTAAAPPVAVDAASHDVPYSEYIAQRAAELAAKADEAIGAGAASRSMALISADLKDAARWNGFLDRFTMDLIEQLRRFDIPAFHRLPGKSRRSECGERHRLSPASFSGRLAVTSLPSSREIRLALEISQLKPAPRPVATVMVRIGPGHYAQAAHEMIKLSIPRGYPPGSRIRPFTDFFQAGEWLATIFACKLDDANAAWRNIGKGEAGFDFHRLHYRFGGLRAGVGIPQSQVEELSRVVYNRLAATGLSINGDARDLGKVLDHVEMYHDLEDVYLNSGTAGQTRLVPSEAVIVGDVVADNQAAGRYRVTMRSLITAANLGITSSQGFVIPALTSHCYLRAGRSASARTGRRDVVVAYEAAGAGSLPETGTTVSTVLSTIRHGLREHGIAVQPEMNSLTQTTSLVTIHLRLGHEEKASRSYCTRLCRLEAEALDMPGRRRLRTISETTPLLHRCGQKVGEAKLRQAMKSLLPGVVEQLATALR